MQAFIIECQDEKVPVKTVPDPFPEKVVWPCKAVLSVIPQFYTNLKYCASISGGSRWKLGDNSYDPPNFNGPCRNQTECSTLFTSH